MYRGAGNTHQVVVMVSKGAHMLTSLNPQMPVTDYWEMLGNCSERVAVKENKLF